MIRQLSHEEFARDWAPVRDRMTDGVNLRDPTWVRVPIPLYLSQGKGPPCWRIADPKTVDEFAPLRNTLGDLRIREICCGPASGTAWDAFLLPPTEEATSGINRITTPHGEWICWFSREGNWCLLQREEWFSVLGGTEAFMRVYLRHAGGMDAVRKRFEDFDISQSWEASWDQSWTVWRAKTYAEFGWKPFPYPNHGNFFERLLPRQETDEIWRPRMDSLVALPLPAQLDKAFVPRWRRAAMAGHLVSDAGREDIRALTSVLAEREDWEICLHSLTQDRWSMVVADGISLGTAKEIACDPITACGGKREWALISLPEGVSMLAAEDEIIDRVLERAGGRPAVEARMAGAQLPASVVERLG